MKLQNKRSKADFTDGNMYIFTNISEGTAFLQFYLVEAEVAKIVVELFFVCVQSS